MPGTTSQLLLVVPGHALTMTSLGRTHEPPKRGDTDERHGGHSTMAVRSGDRARHASRAGPRRIPHASRAGPRRGGRQVDRKHCHESGGSLRLGPGASDGRAPAERSEDHLCGLRTVFGGRKTRPHRRRRTRARRSGA